MANKYHISPEASSLLAEIQEQEDLLLTLPDSEKKLELLNRLSAQKEQLSCGPNCQFCGPSFTGTDEEEPEDPIIKQIASNFQIQPPMNKKVVAGVIIIAAIALTVIGIKMWRKSSAKAIEA